MMRHYLGPLLNPRSVALVGASRTEGAIGNRVLRELVRGGFPGEIYPVNPRYSDIEGLNCFGSLADLPTTPELVVLMLAAERLEAALVSAVEHGAKAATIFDGAFLADAQPPLQERLQSIVREAGLPMCGSNCVGFANLSEKTRISGWLSRNDPVAGGVTFISHSGAVFEALMRNDRRLRYNLIVSAGHELSASADQYIDYALDLPDTRVIGLFLETVRRPEGFVAALEKAQARGIPVVALKVGRTAFAAELAQSHSGAIAGSDVAYRALFDRYGVIQVDDMEEMVATLQLLSLPRRAAPGQLIAVHDSGGEREMVVDMAARLGVEFTRISAATETVLRDNLHPSLKPINPLDAYGGPHDATGILERSLEALMKDENAGIGILFANVSDGFSDHEAYIDVCRAVNARVDKPLIVSTLFTGSDQGDYPLRMQEQAGSPVLFGARAALLAARHAMRYRDRVCPAPEPVALDEASTRKWHERFAASGALSEAESLSFLTEFGVPSQPFRVVSTLQEASEAASALGWPVVLKTAAPGILHKSDVGGVVLNIASTEALEQAYGAMASRLGPQAIVAKQAKGGMELAFGVVSDDQFGPVVIVAAGGTAIEVMADSQSALAPVSHDQAKAMILGLKIAPLLEGHRGAAPLDVAAAADALSALSRLAYAFKDRIDQIDINPFLLRESGGVALDALVLLKPR